LATRKTIAASAVLIAVLVSGSIVVLSNHSTPPISVRHDKSVQTAAGTLTMFEISNQTASPYVVLPLEVEAQENGTWRRCFFFTERLSSSPFAISQYDMIGPHRFTSRGYTLTNLPPEVPLRLRLIINRELTGVRALWQRFQWRYLYHRVHVSLKNTHVFDRKVYQITSEEFMEAKR
jgi:hypothetical protein